MSTRAVYTFHDETESFHVYKHFDGYPTGAAKAIVKALGYAWPLPRYEADEFASSFVAANKTQGGGVRLMQSGAFDDVAPHDIEYHYEVSQVKAGHLLVTCWAVSHVDEERLTKARNGQWKWVKTRKADRGWKRTKLFCAPLKSGVTLMKFAEEAHRADAA